MEITNAGGQCRALKWDVAIGHMKIHKWLSKIRDVLIVVYCKRYWAKFFVVLNRENSEYNLVTALIFIKILGNKYLKKSPITTDRGIHSHSGFHNLKDQT